MTDAFHLWLFDATKHGPLTVVQIVGDVAVMMANGCDCSGLPTDGITCQQWLERLATQGRAVRLNGKGEPDTAGSYWRWAEGVAAVKVVQRQLFA